MASVISGDANVSATEFGYLDGVTSALQTQMDAKLPIAGGKILQIVRATDSTRRTTTSTTPVDVGGMSVTITPTKSTSAIIVLAAFLGEALGSSGNGNFLITDSSNNALSGAERAKLADDAESTYLSVFGYSTPATTSATTYKLRQYQGVSGTVEVRNDQNTGQMYAIEVSA